MWAPACEGWLVCDMGHQPQKMGFGIDFVIRERDVSNAN
jgi:hypothetical protein